MTWTEIRAHYAALHAEARAKGATQKVIARRGGMARQNNVSRLLSNDKHGPTVETFVHAVEGLGKPLWKFFREIEEGPTDEVVVEPAAVETSPLSVLDRLARLERVLDALSLALSASGELVPDGLSASDGKEALHGHPSVSPAIIQRPTVDAILVRWSETFADRLNAHVAAVGARHDTLSAQSPATRTVHHRRTRTSA
jgi:transcriptional regulator with XRE-family HTH domain